MLRVWITTISVGLALASVAGSAPRTPVIYALSGHCAAFTLGGRDVPSGCSDSLLNMNNRRGGTAFTFTFANGAIVSFEGVGARQVNPTPNTAAQPINGVFFSVGIPGVAGHRIKAVGTCTYANPNLGPVTIDCSAQTPSGEFAGRFETDGSAPTLIHQ